MNANRKAQELTESQKVRADVIRQAAEKGITLDPMDIVIVDGSPEIDQMSATDWLSGMTAE